MALPFFQSPWMDLSYPMGTGDEEQQQGRQQRRGCHLAALAFLGAMLNSLKEGTHLSPNWRGAVLTLYKSHSRHSYVDKVIQPVIETPSVFLANTQLVWWTFQCLNDGPG